ncbi:MAG: hypothetical protein QOI31_1592 [Solirubrobacterales bacterium]|nr:hypothetical protein [Solirubrobacterales bacterium]
MSKRSRSIRNRIVALALSVAAILVSPPLAQAGPLSTAENCAPEELSQPFLPWADSDQYTLAPDGGFEEGGSTWSLEDGAGVVAGNESHYVRDAGDTNSLKLPAGSSATSGALCVGIEHPTIRLFARNTGSAFSALKVKVHFVDARGNAHSLPVALVGGDSSWEPTRPIAIRVNDLVDPGEYTPVAFEFTPVGSGGNWRIDDVYVDPYRRS